MSDEEIYEEGTWTVFVFDTPDGVLEVAGPPAIVDRIKAMLADDLPEDQRTTATITGVDRAEGKASAK